jgi:hypothetical protein
MAISAFGLRKEEIAFAAFGMARAASRPLAHFGKAPGVVGMKESHYGISWHNWTVTRDGGFPIGVSL